MQTYLADPLTETLVGVEEDPAVLCQGRQHAPPRSLAMLNGQAASRTLIPEPNIDTTLAVTDTLIARVALSDDPEELLRTIPTTDYLADLLKQEGAGLEAVNRAAEARLRTCRRLGQVLNKLCPNGGDRKSESPRVTVNLKELGINRNRSAKYRRLAEIDEQTFAGELTRMNEAGEEITTSAMVRFDKAGSAPAKPRCTPRTQPVGPIDLSTGADREGRATDTLWNSGEKPETVQELNERLSGAGYRIVRQTDLDTLAGSLRHLEAIAADDPSLIRQTRVKQNNHHPDDDCLRLGFHELLGTHIQAITDLVGRDP